MSWVLDAKGRVEIADVAFDLDLSNDGTRIAIAGKGGVRVCNTSTGKVLATFAEGEKATGVAFVAGGGLAFVAGESEKRDLFFVDKLDKGGKPTAAGAFGPSARVWGIARDRKGGRILVSGSSVQLWDVASRKQIRAIQPAKRGADVFGSLSADGETIYAYGGEPGKIVRHRVEDMRETGRWTAPSDFGSQVLVSPDERFLVAVGDYWKGVALHDLVKKRRVTADSRNVFKFDDDSNSHCWAFSNDSSTLLSIQATPFFFALPEVSRIGRGEPVVRPAITCETAVAAWAAPVVAFGFRKPEQISIRRLKRSE